jgi:hypothetical protein
MVWYF